MAWVWALAFSRAPPPPHTHPAPPAPATRPPRAHCELLMAREAMAAMWTADPIDAALPENRLCTGRGGWR